MATVKSVVINNGCGIVNQKVMNERAGEKRGVEPLSDVRVRIHFGYWSMRQILWCF